jgi:hypothetical protein
MIIHDLDLNRPVRGPAEANALLIVDPNAVLALAIALQRFEPITGGELRSVSRTAASSWSSLRRATALNGRQRAGHRVLAKQALGHRVSEAPVHDCSMRYVTRTGKANSIGNSLLRSDTPGLQPPCHSKQGPLPLEARACARRTPRRSAAPLLGSSACPSLTCGSNRAATKRPCHSAVPHAPGRPGRGKLRAERTNIRQGRALRFGWLLAIRTGTNDTVTGPPAAGGEARVLRAG